MDLIRDVLDNQLVDRRLKRIGKVDGIVVELRPNAPPLVKYLETGWATKAQRLQRRLGAWMRQRSQPYRIPWGHVRDVGVEVKVDLDARQTAVLDVEKRLRKFLLRIPGA